VNKINNQHNAGEVPDEAWWAAILAEENIRTSGPHPQAESPTRNELKPTLPPLASKTGVVNWAHAQSLYTQDETIWLCVVGQNRGGLLVEGDGLYGFVPTSHLVHLSPELEESEGTLATTLTSYMGRRLKLKVIECDQQRGRIVFSERAALAGPGRRNILLNELDQGAIVSGVVTNITDFGVFVDLGGLEGLIHVSELSWGRVRHPEDAVVLGSQIEAYVIGVDKSRSRVALSLKRLHPNPWESAEAHYHPGQIVDAEITCIVPYGAFARLEDGLDGLIHITEMSQMVTGTNATPFQDLLHEGQHVKVRILHVDSLRQRLGLSLKL